MNKYSFTAICKICNQSWPRIISIDQPSLHDEAVKYLGMIMKTHTCKEDTGSWQIDWEPAKE